MAKVQKVGVAWNRKFRNNKEGIKLSIDKKLYVAYKNTNKNKDTDPDYVICRFIEDSK